MRCPRCHRLVVDGTACPRDGTVAPAPPRDVPTGSWNPPPGIVLDSVLGVGGNAVVYAARLGDRAVAVKRSLDGDARRAAREAALLERIGPPYVPAMLGAGPDHLILERIAAPSVADLIARGAFDAPGIATLADALLDALATIHARDVVHGDLSAANILFDGNRVTLIDFGHGSKHDEDALRARTTDLGAGTLHYMAPELLAGAPPSPASDVYAACAVLTEAITGVPPFVGDAVTLPRAIALLRPPPLPPSSPLAAFIERGLAKAPLQRPAARTRGPSPVSAHDVQIVREPDIWSVREANRGPSPISAGEEMAIVGVVGIAVPQLERWARDAHGRLARQRGKRALCAFSSRNVADPLAAAFAVAAKVVEAGGRCAVHVAPIEVARAADGRTRMMGRALEEVDAWWPDDAIALHVTAAAATVREDAEVTLVGRDPELAAAEHAMRRSLASGRPSLVTFVGAPGSGRTRLAAELARRVSSPWTTILLRGTDPDPSATLARLETASRGAPTLVIADDAERLDPTVIVTLQRVLSTDAPTSVIALGTAELLERHPTWGIGVEGAGLHELGPLPDAAGIELARVVLGHEFASAELLADLHAQARGHPRTLVDAARLARVRGETAVPRSAAADWLSNRVLAALPPELEHFVTTLAIAGPAVTPAELDAIEGAIAPPAMRADASAAIVMLSRRGLVRQLGAGWELQPIVLAASVRARAPDERRTRTHALVLDVLTGRDADPETRAEHALAAGAPRVAAELYADLARRARGAYRCFDAERWSSAALDAALPDDRSERADMLILRASMRLRRGRTTEALADADEASRLATDAVTRARADLEAGVILDWAGEFRASWERASRARDANDPTLASAIELAEARWAWRQHQADETVRRLRPLLAVTSGETQVVAGVLLAPALVATGALDEAEVVFAETLARCEAAGDALHACATVGNRGWLWNARRQPESLLADLERCIAYARQLGNPLLERLPTWNVAEMLYVAGRDAEARSFARRAAELSEKFVGFVPEDSLLAARLALSSGDLANARSALAVLDERHDAATLLPAFRLLRDAVRFVLDGVDGPAWAALCDEAEHTLLEDERVELWYLRARATGDPAVIDELRRLVDAWPYWESRARAVPGFQRP